MPALDTLIVGGDIVDGAGAVPRRCDIGITDDRIAELVAELVARDDRHAAALSDMRAIRVAVDQELSGLDSPLAGAREVAFFPPMTGG